MTIKLKNSYIDNGYTDYTEAIIVNDRKRK